MLTSAVEAGFNTFLFPESTAELAQEWQGVTNFQALLLHGNVIKDQDDHVRLMQPSSALLYLLAILR